jgi:hypothetical protein
MFLFLGECSLFLKRTVSIAVAHGLVYSKPMSSEQ